MFLLCFGVILVLPLFYMLFLKKPKQCIKGRHVMISGGSSGIGLSVAKEVLFQGANITLLARDKTKLQNAKEELLSMKNSKKKMFGEIQIFSVDVGGSKVSISEAVKMAESSFGPVFMLVNCAGYARAGKFEDLPEATVRNMLEVNLLGSFFLSQEVVQSMKRADEGGMIVFVSSLAGLLGIFGYTAYSASKGALVKMAECLHMELKPYNISVTVSYPPDTDTPGFTEENKSKPVETILISEGAGLYKADDVAKALINDAQRGKFSSYVGLDGFMLSTLCAGMGPITRPISFLSQIFLAGIFRIVSMFYLWNFGKIISKERVRRVKSKKVE